MEDLLEEIAKELPPAECRETYQTLGKILGNILANPQEVKFRSLKKENKMISTKLLRSQSAVSLLLAMGFDDDGGSYTLLPDADLEMVRTLSDLIECLLLSSPEPEAPPVAVAAPAASVASSAPAVAMATQSGASLKPAAKANPQGWKDSFGRRNDVESKRQDQVDQLQAARAAQRAQYEVNPAGPQVAPVVSDAKANGYPTATSDAAAKKKPPSANDFASRGKKEQERNEAANSLQEMRKAQKDKFKDFQADPNAAKQEAYKAPPSVAAGAQEDGSWGGWFGGMFGGGSSSSGQQPKPIDRERKGPRIKGVGDLPKPVQRGG